MTRRRVIERGEIDAVILRSRVVASSNEKNLIVLGIVIADVAWLWVGRTGSLEINVAQCRQG